MVIGSRSGLRAVFFDLDDTLCDTVGTREQRARLALESLTRHHAHLDVERLLARVLEPIPGDRTVRGLRAVLEENGLAQTAPGQDALRTFSYIGCEHFLRTFEGVTDTLSQLSSNYILGVITNWDGEEEQLNKLRHLKLDHCIQHVVVSGSVGYEKPDARIFEHALALADVEANEAVFVGDRLDVDVGGAQAAGMKAVWFNHWGGILDGALVRPDAIITHFRELPEALEGLSA